MSRESCIQHRAHNRIAIVREDYFDLTGDAVAAALLNYFEYRANSALAKEAEPENIASVNVGPISIAEIQISLLGLSTDKQIRRRLGYLREQRIITCPDDTRQGKTPTYTVEVGRIQLLIQGTESAELFGQTTAVKQPRSNNRGQITEPLRSNNRSDIGQITEELRSNDRYSLYKNLDSGKSLESEAPPTPQGGGCVAVQCEVVQPEPTGQAISPAEYPDQQAWVEEGNASSAAPPSGSKKKNAIAVDVPAWVMSHNQHKPDGWSGCRGLGPKAVEAVRAVIEFYGGDQALALESHALALQAVRTDPRLRWWRDKSGDVMTAIYPTKIDARIGAWAESARAKGLNPDAVAASGLNESQIQQASVAADPLTAKLLHLMKPRRALNHG